MYLGFRDLGIRDLVSGLRVYRVFVVGGRGKLVEALEIRRTPSPEA